MKRQRGMTLIEVMIAMALLAIAGLALMKTSQEQVRNLSYLEQKQLAGWVAANQMALLHLAPAAVPEHGEVTLAGEQWRWQRIMQPTTEAGIKRVEMAVWHNRAEGTPLVRLFGWVAQ